MPDKNKTTEEDLEVVPDEEEEISPDAQKKFKQLKENLKRCETDRKEYLEGWQRAKADYINYKNEDGKRMEDMARFITAGFIQEILPVLDSFAALENHFKDEPRPSEDGRDLVTETEKGILLIRSQFEDVLRKRGLEQIKVEPGEKFNPEKHESVGEVESEFSEGAIAEEVQKGYWLREKVLRPVRVRLSKKPPD